MLLRFRENTQAVGQTDLVVHVPVMLQVLGILVEFPAVHAAHGIHDQVVMQVARVHMGGD